MDIILPTMKGRLFYFAAIALVGLLSILEHFMYGGLFLAAILYFYRIKKFPAAMLAMLAVNYLIFFAAGFDEKNTFSTSLAGNEENFVILFNDGITIDGDKLSAIAEAYPVREDVVVRYRLATDLEKEKLKKTLLPGIACKASGTMEAPSAARNPHSFSYQSYLNRKGISWLVNIEHLDTESCVDISGGILTALKRFREKQVNDIEEYYPKETAALSAALIFGDRNLFDPDTERSYQKIGVVHLLAISGLHVGLLAGMLYFILLRTGIAKERAEEIMLLFLPAYAIITGLAPPVVRSAAMLILLIAARRFQFKLTPLDAISIAFMVMVFIQPNLIYDIGFQLSFSVSFSLMISTNKILPAFHSFISQTAAASFIAQLSSLPIILFAFYEISLISIMANLLFIPLFSFVMLPVILIVYLIFSFTKRIPETFFRMLEDLVHLINRLAAFLAEVPGAVLTIGKPGIASMIFFAIAIPVFFTFWEKSFIQKKKMPAWIILLPLIPVLLQIILPYINPYGKVTFIDVGQGDSIFIQLPFNEGNYLIDTGGVMEFEREGWQDRRDRFDPGLDIVLPFLKSQGVREIDKLILTHGDSDHIGGAVAILGEVDVRQIILPRATDRSPLEAEIIRMAVSEGTEIYAGGEGTSWKTASAEFKLLGPAETEGDRNERSIVVLAKLGGMTLLFTGDLGIEGEKSFLEKYSEVDIDILKVGHHGSKYSSSSLFLESIRPEYAVISVGAKNRYGHPGEEVLKRLEDSRIRVFRTDQDGAVIYRFIGDSGTFHTQIP